MAATRTDTFEQRAAILSGLAARNRVVGLLRLAVPAAGVVAFVALAAEIYVTNLAKQYGVSAIRIDRGNLVVDTPRYSGVSAGARFVVTAAEARSPVGQTPTITMSEVTLEVTRPDQPAMHLSAASAVADTANGIVTVPGVATLTSDNGMHGTLTQLSSDTRAGTTSADGPVELTFAGGATLSAAAMHYDGNTRLWAFDRATLVLPDLPGAAP